MTEDEKRKIAERLLVRVVTGLSFIESNYLFAHSTPDAAWIRNIYILLSFYSELQLKAIVVMCTYFDNLVELDKKLRVLGHDLEKIGTELGQKKLSEFGIKRISLKDNEYSIETENGSFLCKRFY